MARRALRVVGRVRYGKPISGLKSDMELLSEQMPPIDPDDILEIEADDTTGIDKAIDAIEWDEPQPL